MARERQQSPGEIGAPIHRFQCLLGQFVEPGLSGQLLVQQFQVAHDHREQVVEIVGDTSGELADGLHFLRLPELGFGLLALGDVVRDDDGGGLGVELHVERRGPRFEPAQSRSGLPVSYTHLDVYKRQPKLNPKSDSAKWLSDKGAPWKKLDNEKPKGETIAYETLLAAWKAGKVR